MHASDDPDSCKDEIAFNESFLAFLKVCHLMGLSYAKSVLMSTIQRDKDSRSTAENSPPLSSEDLTAFTNQTPPFSSVIKQYKNKDRARSDQRHGQRSR